MNPKSFFPSGSAEGVCSVVKLAGHIMGNAAEEGGITCFARQL